MNFYIVTAVVFLILIILYALLPLYNKVSPTIGGLPMFYWYQTIMLVVTSILLLIPVLLVKEPDENKR
ncbi:MAG: DUF3311 domain-containing protein [Sulfolobaceae archaeon]|nr:DUF3311 domain-containing protein [Sulfolobaceae archaeon]